MSSNNPAARLYKVLEDCRSLDKDIKRKAAVQGWAKVLGLEGKDSYIVLSKIGKILALPEQIATEIRQIKVLSSHDHYLEWQPEFFTLFLNMNIGSSFENFSTRITKGLMAGIARCDDQLKTHRPEKEILPADLLAVRQQADELYETVSVSELDPALKRFLTDRLYMIIDAIDNYNLTGGNGLVLAMDATLGSFFCTNHEIAKELKDTEFKEPFIKLMSRIWLVLQITTTVPMLPEAFDKIVDYLT